ncbi:MAG TPA: rod shape-determining protein MreC [Gemmatimonadaceae bacterium]|jgi:rod shape-determining protein MreC
MVLAGACGVAALLCLVLPASARSSGAAALRTTVVAPLASLEVKSELAHRAFLTHDAALRMVDSVALRSQRLAGVQDENDRLRKLLGLGATLKWGFIPAEALQGGRPGDDFTVTLSAGSDAGVVKLAPVVTTEGLVGMVERVDKALSVAIFWPHPDFRVSAMSADGSAFGIVTGHSGEGATRYYLELHSVPLRTPLKTGTLIVSSGLGGVYPRGIPVGIVIAELKTPEGFAKNYLVRPMVSPPDISSVFILTSARVRAGVSNVWSMQTTADSARRGIVVAGDSIRAHSDTTPKKRLAKPDTTARKPAVKPDTTEKKPDTTARKPDTTAKKPAVKTDTLP